MLVAMLLMSVLLYFIVYLSLLPFVEADATDGDVKLFLLLPLGVVLLNFLLADRLLFLGVAAGAGVLAFADKLLFL